jgi:hypothetical protein
MNPATGVALGDRPVAGSVAESPNAAQILSGTLPTGHQQETSMMRSILRDALRHGTLVTSALALAAVATLASCGDNGAGPSTTALSISLTDAPGDIQHAFVTITEIQLVGENGILVLRDEPYTADLLTLAGQTADLVTGFEVTSGTYEQLRFLISGACIAAENASGGSDIYTTTDYDSDPCGGPPTGTLIAPSYAETGLKVQFSGDVLEIDGAQTILLVDFDVEQSFGQQAGQSGMWVMHPVVTGAEIETE